MIRATGFYGHKRKNHIRSLIMFLGFALTLQLTIAALLTGPIFFFSKGALPTPLSRPIEYLKLFAPGIFCVSVILFYLNYWFHESLIKAATGFEYIQPIQNRTLSNLVEEIAITAGIPVPKIGVLPSQALNSFTCGRDPNHATIIFTKGLLDNLNQAELRAVIAHEITHIANGDMELMAYANASHSLNKCLIFINPFQMKYIKLDSETIWILPFLLPLMFIAIIMGIVIKISSTLSNFSRYLIVSSREFIADAEAVRLTHNPEALISALRKIEGRSHVRQIDSITESMMIDGDVDGEYASHPPIQDRISALVQYSGNMINGTDTPYQRSKYGELAKNRYRSKAQKNVLQRLNAGSDRTITGLPKAANIFVLIICCGLATEIISPGTIIKKKEPRYTADILSNPQQIEYSPAYLAIRLSGSRFQSLSIAHAEAFYFSAKTGQRQHTGWLSLHSGFLFYDANSDGEVSQKEMLILDPDKAAQTSSLYFLKKYDSNQDGKLNKNDKTFSKIKVWRDYDEDGFTNKWEIKSLENLQITELNYLNGEHYGPDGHITEAGAKLYSSMSGPAFNTIDTPANYSGTLYWVSFETDLANSHEDFKAAKRKLDAKPNKKSARKTQTADRSNVKFR